MAKRLNIYKAAFYTFALEGNGERPQVYNSIVGDNVELV
jgi:hypothetical protein